MSRIVERPGKNGRTQYQVRYDTPEGPERGSKTFRRKADAVHFLKANDTDLLRGTFIDPKDAQIPFGDVVERWMEMQVSKPSTRRTTESRLRKHVLPAFQHRPIGAIRKSEVQAWIGSLSGASLAPSTIEACYTALRTVMQSAVEDQLIPASPCVRIKLPRIERGLIQPLPHEAVRAIRGELPDRVKAMATLGAGAGLRVAEALGLTVDRVDFLRHTITIDRQQVLLTGQPPTLGSPKTQASNRAIPVPSWVTDDLARHVAEFGIEREALLFQTNLGNPVRRTRFSDTWRTAARKTSWPDANFHDLRHHHASVLIAAGCSVKVVQRQLGHASARETLDTYAHLWPDDDDKVRDALASAWDPPKSRPTVAHEA